MEKLISVKAPSFIPLIFRGYENFSASDKIEKVLFFYFSVMMCCGAIVWAMICLFAGHQIPAMVPLAYVLITGFNFFLCTLDGDSKLGCTLQVFASISLPFVFQYALGGIANSGYVMLWSILALLGSMSFQTRRMIYIWMGLFLSLSVGSFVVEYFKEEQGLSNIPVLLTAMNLTFVSSIIFFLCHAFLKMESDLRNVLSEKREGLRRANQQLGKDISLAREFQDLVQRDVVAKQIFAEKLIIDTREDTVEGNFHWQGEFLHNKVAVFISNPHSGIRGGMESMVLWNLIENAASSAEVDAPEDLIEMVQRALYSRYNVQEIRDNLKEIDMAVLRYDTMKEEVYFATTGVKILAGSASNEIEVLSGFSKTSMESLRTANDTQVYIGKRKAETGMSIVVANDAVLETLNIEDDTDLSNSEGSLSSLVQWSFEIGEKQIRRKLQNSDQEATCYLMALQI